ncbi:MAG: hypothetical protein GY750_11605 [Lentisphaerae bacterium]|nr:hypothetical protein [Lentisphaerota bacterium]
MKEWTVIYIGEGNTTSDSDHMSKSIWENINSLMDAVEENMPADINIAIGYQGRRLTNHDYSQYNGHYLYGRYQGHYNIRRRAPGSNNWDFTDHRQIAKFINLVVNKENFQAKKYLLIFSSHGAGVAFNSPSGNIADRRIGASACRGANKSGLTVREMQALMYNIKGILGQPLDILSLDACLMQTISIPISFRSSVNYYVANQPEAPGVGTIDYTKLITYLHKMGDVPARKLAIDLTNHLSPDEASGLSLSTIDVEMISSLHTKRTINSFARHLMMLGQHRVHKILLQMGYLHKEGKTMRDLIAFMRKAAGNCMQVQQWINQINNCILAKRVTSYCGNDHAVQTINLLPGIVQPKLLGGAITFQANLITRSSSLKIYMT